MTEARDELRERVSDLTEELADLTSFCLKHVLTDEDLENLATLLDDKKLVDRELADLKHAIATADWGLDRTNDGSFVLTYGTEECPPHLMEKLLNWSVMGVEPR